MHSPRSLDVRPDVAAALKANLPVVAMVSAPLSRTLPWPVNLETVREAEEAVRQEGAILAIVAVWEGRLTVGLDPKKLETITRGENVRAATRRDLPTVVVGGHVATTTVSASTYVAWLAGIPLLTTGAIGGVARQAASDEEHVWDVSADLVELYKTPVAIVSAGSRSLHHVGHTSEILETFSIPVVGYKTDFFPTFYLRAGNHLTSARADTPTEVAALLSAHWGLDGAGIVVTQPTPAEVAFSPDELVPALRTVEKQAADDHVIGMDLSQSLMQRLNRMTRGKALKAYQAILVANARLAAQIASALPPDARKAT